MSQVHHNDCMKHHERLTVTHFESRRINRRLTTSTGIDVLVILNALRIGRVIQ
jgi:hypothetical protein